MSRLSRAALGYLDHYCAGFWIGPAAPFGLGQLTGPTSGLAAIAEGQAIGQAGRAAIPSDRIGLWRSSPTMNW
jgi:hypothetical protein